MLLFMAAGCSAPYSKPDGGRPSSAPKLIGTTWRAVEILGRKASFFAGQKMDAHLILHSGGRLGGSTGCNNVNGVYNRNAGKLSFTSLGTTRMACSPNIMEQERRFLGAMRSTAAYEISGRRLILFDRGGRAVMELIAVR
ncbi:MAG: META domain-containing protein [Chlorobium sp.]|uniref:META domain-containing protein n=1 Tax=Chlorobium sp. TaxID=1095 RepID=UPI0025C6C379|nr:META domain-containing protein [Chlorobium sp.]MCF8383255.1 META domain-containing protein [Chlorobium sp.]